MMRHQLALEWIHGRFAICRLDVRDAVPAWAGQSSNLLSITRTDRELSIVAAEEAVPDSVKAERGWVAMRIADTLDFSLVGILSRLTGALAEANVPIFVISTYDTDILLVRADDADRAREALSHVANTARLRA